MNTLDLNDHKVNGQDTLEAQEWNTLITGVNTLITEVNNIPSGGGGGSDTSSYMYVNDKGNLSIETTINNTPANKKGKINIESRDDIQIKPGDDFIVTSSHRDVSNRDEVSMKIHDGNDHPIKLQLNAANIVLTTKDKELTKTKSSETGEDTSTPAYDDPEVMNVTVNSDKNTRGYLKVRAQAIDLRSETHGGIALQPKGFDSDDNMNKIKFEHGGGDGLEFGTFNTEKTSIFTDEYRFNREGIWKMATRQTEVSDKADASDATTAYKYVKQTDDFYDIISQDDEQCKTKDIIKTAYALNGAKDRHTNITKKGAIEIATNVTWVLHITTDNGSAVNINTISDEIAALSTVVEGTVYNDGDFKVGKNSHTPNTSAVYTNGTQYFSFTEVEAPSIKIDSGSELKLGGVLDFGSTFNFGETDNGIEFQYKLTKNDINNYKPCDTIKIIGFNNHASDTLTVPDVVDATTGNIADVTIAAGSEPQVVTSCSMLDIINLVNWMKANEQGPWTPADTNL